MYIFKITTLFPLFVLTLCLGTSNASWADPSTEATQTTDTKPTTTPVDDGKININTASASELRTLKGVGKKRAEQIVKDREANGPFKSAQDLTRIKGIGPKTVEKNLELITVGSSPKTENSDGSSEKKE